MNIRAVKRIAIALAAAGLLAGCTAAHGGTTPTTVGTTAATFRAWDDGTYTVGVDIPAGKYATLDTTPCQVSVDNQPAKTLTSVQLVASDRVVVFSGGCAWGARASFAP